MVETFQGLDTSGDGRISKQELVRGYVRFYGNEKEAQIHAEEIFKKLDHDHSGLIELNEFISSILENTRYLSRSKIQKAFLIFDTDQNGFISKEELRGAMGGINLDDKTLDELTNECDINKDGKVRLC